MTKSGPQNWRWREVGCTSHSTSKTLQDCDMSKNISRQATHLKLFSRYYLKTSKFTYKTPIMTELLNENYHKAITNWNLAKQCSVVPHLSLIWTENCSTIFCGFIVNIKESFKNTNYRGITGYCYRNKYFQQLIIWVPVEQFYIYIKSSWRTQVSADKTLLHSSSNSGDKALGWHFGVTFCCWFYWRWEWGEQVWKYGCEQHISDLPKG